MDLFTENSEVSEPTSRLSYSRMDPDEAEAAFQRRREELKKIMKVGAPGSVVQPLAPAANCFRNITESFSTMGHKRSMSHSRTTGEVAEGKREEGGRVRRKGGESGRTESLFRRQVEWKQKAVEKAEKLRKFNSEKEMENCTFNPQLAKPVGSHIQFIQVHPQGKLPERAQLWVKEKVRKTEEMREMASERELEDCTFHPKVKTQSKTFDSTAYFQRQVSWKKDVNNKIAVLDAKVHSRPPTQPAKPPSHKPKPCAPDIISSKEAEERVLKLQQALGVLEDRVNSSLGMMGT